ncbi:MULTISPECIES: HTH domain-containing protein [unclassified Clostridioides]
MLFISKLANALRMMILIQSRGKMKCKELAEELEVSERQIKS